MVKISLVLCTVAVIKRSEVWCLKTQTVSLESLFPPPHCLQPHPLWILPENGPSAHTFAASLTLCLSSCLLAGGQAALRHRESHPDRAVAWRQQEHKVRADLLPMQTGRPYGLWRWPDHFEGPPEFRHRSFCSNITHTALKNLLLCEIMHWKSNQSKQHLKTNRGYG